MPRFVILEHDHPTFHWDFMLEAGDVLRTWRLSEAPQTKESCLIAAERIGDHRLTFLDYEGPVSQGRGFVTRWDHGAFRWVFDVPEGICAILRGSRLQACVSLQLIAGKEWSLVIVPDAG